MFSNGEFRETWYEMLVTKFIPKLISMVRGEVPLDVKYAACCVFRSVALYEDLIVYVTDQILPCVLQMRNASAKFKVSLFINFFFIFLCPNSKRVTFRFALVRPSEN